MKQALLLYAVTTVAAFTTAPLPSRLPAMHSGRHRNRSGKCFATMEPADETDEERRARLEALGKQAADEQAFMDTAASDDDGLMQEFNARLNDEGGANLFKLKTEAQAVGEGAKDVANAAQGKVQDVANVAGGLVSGLNEQQKNVAKIILGLIAFQIFIGFIASAFSGTGGGGYGV